MVVSIIIFPKEFSSDILKKKWRKSTKYNKYKDVETTANDVILFQTKLHFKFENFDHEMFFFQKYVHVLTHEVLIIWS